MGRRIFLDFLMGLGSNRIVAYIELASVVVSWRVVDFCRSNTFDLKGSRTSPRPVFKDNLLF